MATCAESINAIISAGGLPGLTEIYPNTITPFSVTPAANGAFLLRSPSFQTVTFSVILSTNPYNTQFVIFKLNGDTVTQMGIATIASASGTFVADFPIGNYLICVRANGNRPQVGTIVGRFTGYSQIANMAISMASGEAVQTNVTFPRPPRECNAALYFRIEEGELPPQLQMDDLGTIRGQLPNLDCLEDRLSPAVNWYFDENDGSAWPWGREWRFKVKVAVAGMEDTAWAEEWFCIRIYNNWSYDLENFLAQAPFEKVENVRVVEEVPKLPSSICVPCASQAEPAPFIPQPIERPEDRELLGQPGQSANVELIPIPAELASVQPYQMVAWYDLNQNADLTNPNIAQFRDQLAQSEAFQILRARAGYVDPETPKVISDREFVNAINYQNFLQLSIVRLDPAHDPESLQQLLKMWREHENQVLPYTGFVHFGEGMEVNLV